MLLTKSDSLILGNIARILGVVMNAIFVFLDKITGGHPNTGVAIILMTIIIYLLMMPLTVRQQKYAKLQNKMMPEIQKIQAKYKNRKDTASMQRMQEETKDVYAKYGVSPSGSCVQLIIQMPILFALYRVMYKIPAYVDQVREVFNPLVDGLVNKIGISSSTGIMEQLSSYAQYKGQFGTEEFLSNANNYAGNTFVDVLNRASSADWELLKSNAVIMQNGLAETVASTHEKLNQFNTFLGLNIGDAPIFSIKNSGGNVLVILVAVLIPILAAVSQYLNVKLMPQPASDNNGDESTMSATMKSMNTTMPIFSAVMCFTLPAGIGIYWVAGAIVRTIQQVIINKHLDRIDIDAIVEKNEEKLKEKNKNRVRKEAGTEEVTQSRFAYYAKLNTKNLGGGEKTTLEDTALDTKLRENAKKKYKAGSISARANMVASYSRNDGKEAGTDETEKNA